MQAPIIYWEKIPSKIITDMTKAPLKKKKKKKKKLRWTIMTLQLIANCLCFR